MKGRAFKLVVFLLLGAIVNVAVAWGCGSNAPLPLGHADDALSQDEASELWRRHGLGGSVQRRLPLGWREHHMNADTSWIGTSLMATCGNFLGFAVAPDVSDVFVVEAGIPFRSLCYVRQDVVSTMSTMPAPPGQVPGKDRVAWRNVTPIASGFAINTLFYAAILWLMFAAPLALRRRRRVKRGLCPACAYPIGESDVCTECGKPVSGCP